MSSVVRCVLVLRVANEEKMGGRVMEGGGGGVIINSWGVVFGLFFEGAVVGTYRDFVRQ